MEYLERHIPVVRRGDGGTIVETAAEVCAVAFTHHTSRQTAIQAGADLPPDPQLHTHVLITLARRHDGHIVAINSAALFHGRRELQAVYHNALATGLAALGLEIERGTGRGKHYFEVKGVPAALCADLSGRHAEIEEERVVRVAEFRAEYGREPRESELRDLAIRTRMPKGNSYAAPADYWRALGAEHGLTAAGVDALRTGTLPSPAMGRARVIGELLAADGLTREHATFDSLTLRIAAFERAAGIARVPDTIHAVADMYRRGEVIGLRPDIWTTREMLAIEKAVRAWRDELWERPAGERATADQVWSAMTAMQRDHGVTLAGEQLDAVRGSLRAQFAAVTGEAGVGKGIVAATLGHVWRMQRRRVFAVAVAGGTAQDFGNDIGAGTQAMPIAGLITRLEHGVIQLSSDVRDVIVIDEAGQVSTRQWYALHKLVGERADIVAFGDDAQLGSLEAAGLWPVLAKGGTRLQHVHRTAVAWQRQAWHDLRRGAADTALAAYADDGYLTVSATRTDGMSAALDAWDRDGRTGLIVTDASNAERDELNRQAQERKSQAGELGSDGVALAPTSPLFHAGDRVVFARQWRIGPGTARVENGTTGTVRGVDSARGVVTVHTDEREPRTLDVVAGSAESLLGLAYAAHVFKAQGRTVDRSYVIAGGWQTHRESLYVACSRSRLSTHIFVDLESVGREVDADALAELAVRGSRSRAKVAASDYLGGTPRRKHRRPRKRLLLAHSRPLIESFVRRRELRAVRRERRHQRALAASTARLRDAQVDELLRREQSAPDDRVPQWVVQAFEEVTRVPYMSSGGQ